MNNQYEIRTIADLVEVINGDNFEVLAADLANFVSMVAFIKGDNKTGVAVDCFHWIDDGENRGTGIISSDGKPVGQIDINGGVEEWERK